MSTQAEIEADLPRLQRATVIIPADRVATLFSSPFVLVEGVPGKIIIPTHIQVRKQAGVAWTTTSSGTLRVAVDTAVFFGLFDQTATTAFFGAAEAVWVAEGGAGQFWSLGGVTSSSAINGGNLRLLLSGANISGGSGGLVVDVWYRVWPGL